MAVMPTHRPNPASRPYPASVDPFSDFFGFRAIAEIPVAEELFGFGNRSAGHRMPSVRIWQRSLTRALVLVIAVALAFSGPLSELPSALDPVAWFRLTAVLPLPVVLLSRGIRRGGEIEDHQVDMIVAFVLIGSALLIALGARDGDGGPAQALVSLPLFAAGAMVLLYGVGVIWRIRLPLAPALFAASPPASGILGWIGSGPGQLAVIVAVVCLGLFPLIRRSALEIGSIGALEQPTIGAAPLFTTSCLLLVATTALAVALAAG